MRAKRARKSHAPVARSRGTIPPWFKQQLRREFLPGRAHLVRLRFPQRPVQPLPVSEFLPGLPLFQRRPTPAAPPHRGAVSRRAALRGVGVVAAGAAEVPLVLRATRHRRLVAEARTRTDVQQLTENHSGITHYRAPVAVHITGCCVTYEFAFRNTQFLHRRKHHHRRPQPAHGYFLLAANFE